VDPRRRAQCAVRAAWANMRLEPVDQYLRSFQWNKIKYRADKPLADLIDSLQKVRPPLPARPGQI
jgi:hypothetical protein